MKNQSQLVEEPQKIYFLGIGGIGMSALAYYFLSQGKEVYGYDSTPTSLTETLQKKGAKIHFDEDISQIPEGIDLVVHTPAVGTHHQEYQYFIERKIPIYKRSQILGLITQSYPTIAIAGTHGKTTTTAMVATILHPETPIIAFIGGVAKNFDTNFLLDAQAQCAVVEADEFDRSFLTLSPTVAVITSMDADHLDIYGDKSHLEESFQLFANRVPEDGTLIVHEAVAERVNHPHKITYGLHPNNDYCISEVVLAPETATFKLHQQRQQQVGKQGVLTPCPFQESISLQVSGMQNVEGRRQNAECRMQNAECRRQNAERRRQNAEGRRRKHLLASVWDAQCTQCHGGNSCCH
ncbi:MAG: Mur ligase domain-containing protein [Bacteroidales bacterium]|jgi:UDP-N-acetylmuramate--alanine ligase|nr:Mur ligase domain-containing protein [Bacteroidales bacterium]